MGKERAAFMRGNYGAMTHWLYTPVGTEPKDGNLSELTSEWNAKVNAFDVKNLASQLDRAGVKWFILTIGQNSGYYCSPNPVYDSIVGYPFSKCSKRDLFLDLAVELKKYGIKAMAYLPSGAPDGDVQAMEKLKWKDGKILDKNGDVIRSAWGFREYDKTHRLEEFQKMWEEVITCWTRAWGEYCAGWWIDGCYYAENMYKPEKEPNFRSFARALRAGNPDAALAFNPGIQRMDTPYVQSDEEDYSTGELNSYLFIPFGRKKIPQDIAAGMIGNAQFHLLNFLGSNWGIGDTPRISDDLTISWTKYIMDNNGGVTWDLPTSATGEIPESFIQTLNKLKKAV